MSVITKLVSLINQFRNYNRHIEETPFCDQKDIVFARV
jgi:hypothetical protein